MAAPKLGIFALVIFLILLTRTYSHRTTILRFEEVTVRSFPSRLLLICYRTEMEPSLIRMPDYRRPVYMCGARNAWYSVKIPPARPWHQLETITLH